MFSLKAVVVAVVVVLGATACQPVPPAPRPSVVLVGDSISHGSSDQLHAVFGTLFPWNFSMFAVSGQTVAGMRGDIRARVQFDPDVMVIALGTNDVGYLNRELPGLPAVQGRYNTAVQQMRGAMDDMASIDCVVWIDVNDWTLSPSGDYDLRNWAPHYNAQLRREAAARGNVHVVDYAAQIRAEGSSWLATHFDWPMQLHPMTVESKQTVAAIMARGVRDNCGI